MAKKEFAEKLKLFSEQVEAAQQAQTWQGHDAAAEVYEELMATLEKMYTAEEEMRQQQESLDQTEASLWKAHHHYHDLFESAPLGYLVTDAQGVIYETNRAAAALLHTEPMHLIGKPLAIYVSQEEQAFFRSKLLEMHENANALNWETRLQPRGNGAVVPAAVTCTKVVEEHSGDPVERLRWLIYDLTAHELSKNAEREKIFDSTFEQSPVGMAYLTPDGKWLRVNQALCDMLGYSQSELQERTFLDFTYPDDVAKSAQTHQQLIQQKTDRVSLEKRYRHKDGALIWVKATSSLVLDTNQQPLYSISVIENITEQKRIEAVEREQRLLAETLQDTAINLTKSLQMDDVLDDILSSLERVIAHDAVTVMLVDSQIATVVRTQGYQNIGLGRLNASLRRMRVDVQYVDLLKQMTSSKRPVLRSAWEDYGDFEDLPQINKIHSLVSAPFISHDDVLGFIHLHSRTRYFFNEKHAQILKAFAAQASIAIQNAQYYQQAQQIAVMEERQRLARDLHDAVSQTLFSSVLITETLPKIWSKSPNELGKYLKDLEVLNRSAMAEMRLLLLELRPEQLLKVSLHDQIIQLTEAVSGRKRIQFDLHLDQTEHERQLAPEVKVALFRITQEALNNIIKHAHATQVRVGLSGKDGKIRLEIQDNGQGFDDEVARSGLGLISMQERADQIQASLKVRSAVGEGTTVLLIWVSDQAQIVAQEPAGL